jgi:hypothetical protein
LYTALFTCFEKVATGRVTLAPRQDTMPRFPPHALTILDGLLPWLGREHGRRPVVPHRFCPICRAPPREFGASPAVCN